MELTLKWWPGRRRRNTASKTVRTIVRPQLTESQWLRIADLFPNKPMTQAGGRPSIPSRPCLEGILWILTSGARWQARVACKKGPSEFPSDTTCWRRFRDWTESGLWERAWARLLAVEEGFDKLDWTHLLADGSFSPAKKGVIVSVEDAKAKAPRCCC
jgi:transposase